MPSGQAGKKFVLELARLFRSFADRSSLERIALKAAMLMPLLLLQKPHPKSKAKDHVACLDRRLTEWDNGGFEDLVREGRAIQNHLVVNQRSTRLSNERLGHTFAKLMMAGRTASALRLLPESEKSRLLRLDDQAEGKSIGTTIRDVPREKHPPAQRIFLLC